MRQKLMPALAVGLCLGGFVQAQDTTASATTPASSAEVEQLRQQVQALTEMVQSLQEQVKDQQAAAAQATPAGGALPQTPSRHPCRVPRRALPRRL